MLFQTRLCFPLEARDDTYVLNQQYTIDFDEYVILVEVSHIKLELYSVTVRIYYPRPKSGASRAAFHVSVRVAGRDLH